jgi:hypothetical protein
MSTALVLTKVSASSATTVAVARADVELARARLLDRFDTVKRELTRSTDWRSAARKHPVAAVLGALAVGFVLSRILRNR